jgi:hypothetical protein
MAQIVKLRRSSISGQKPTNSNLQLGEIALNTTDGKAFMSVSGSNGTTVQEFIITNTVNTGSINLVGNITASNFTGSIGWDNIKNYPTLISGSSQVTYSGITGLPDIVLTSQTSSMNVLSASYATTAAFALNTLGGGNQAAIGSYRTFQQTTPQTTWSFQHNIGQRYPIFQVFDENGDVVVPSKIRAIDENNSEILFSLAQRGVIIASLGGGNGAVEQFTNSSLWVVNHNLGTEYPNVTVWDNNKRIVIPNKIQSITNNQLEISFDTPISGYVSIARGGHILSGSLLLWNNIGNKPNNIVSGSDQLTGSYDSRYILNGSITSIFNQTGSYYNTSNNIGITGSLVVSGDVDALNFNTTSDKLIKTNLERIEGALDKIEQINGYTFNWLQSYKDDQKRQIGLLANEVHEVQPELTTERTITLNGVNENILLLDYSKITALLIEAVKELNDKIKKLENKRKRKLK